MRFDILDGFRGYFLIIMFVVHANYDMNAVVGKLNHHSFGWVEDAQGFIFISGLVVGLVYGGIMLRRGNGAFNRALGKRICTIYAYHASLVAFMVCLTWMLGSHAPQALKGYSENTIPFAIGSLFLFSASSHMGILPMYLFFMMITPFVLHAFQRNESIPVAVLSVTLWMVAQTELIGVAATALEAWMKPVSALHFGIYFNVFAWQPVYFLGLYFGWKLARGELDLSWLKRPEMAKACACAALYVFLFGIYDRIVNDYWISNEYSNWFLESNRRGLFGPIWILSFFMDIYVVTWLIVAGGDSSFALVRRAHELLRWFFTLRPFVFLGRHSLQVFSFHVVMVYVMYSAVAYLPQHFLGQSALLFVLVLSLFIPAWAHARYGRWAEVRRVAVQVQH